MSSLNLKELDPWNQCKTNMFLEKIQGLPIDIMMLQETNVKQNAPNEDKMH